MRDQRDHVYCQFCWNDMEDGYDMCDACAKIKKRSLLDLAIEALQLARDFQPVNPEKAHKYREKADRLLNEYDLKFKNEKKKD